MGVVKQIDTEWTNKRRSINNEVESIIEAFEAHKRLQDILDRYDGGFYDLMTRNYDKDAISQAYKVYHDLRNKPKLRRRYCEKLANTQELRI